MKKRLISHSLVRLCLDSRLGRLCIDLRRGEEIKEVEALGSGDGGIAWLSKDA